METKYETKVYFILKTYLTLTGIIFSILGLTIYLCVALKIPPVWSAIGVIVAFVSPLVYAKKLKSYFTYSANLIFDDVGFRLQIIEGNKQKTVAYKWNNLKWYRFYFRTDNYMSLDIYQKIGNHKQFLFLSNNTGKEAIEQNGIFSTFRKYLKNYNKCHREAEITFIPGFFATRLGTIVLWLITLMVVVAIIMHVFKPAKSIGFLIMGICALIPLWVKRNQDKKFYERMSKLDEEMKPL